MRSSPENLSSKHTPHRLTRVVVLTCIGGFVATAQTPTRPRGADADLNQRGLAEMAAAKYDAAERSFRQALATYKKTAGVPDAQLEAGTMNNLAEVYRLTGRWPEAESLYKRALRLYDRGAAAKGDYASALNNLAILYYSQGKPGRAEPLVRQAVQLLESGTDRDVTKLTAAYSNLGCILTALGRQEESRQVHTRALILAETHLGPAHITTAGVLHNFAGLYEEEARYDRAEELYKRALAIWREALGPQHPNVASALANLATICYKDGRRIEAEQYYLRSLYVFEKAYGPDHHELARTLADYALLLRKLGRKREAASCERRSRALLDRQVAEIYGRSVVDVRDLGKRR